MVTRKTSAARAAKRDLKTTSARKEQTARSYAAKTGDASGAVTRKKVANQAYRKKIADIGAKTDYKGTDVKIEKGWKKNPDSKRMDKQDKVANLGTRTMMSGRYSHSEDNTNIQQDSWATGHPREDSKRTNNWYAGKKARAADVSKKTGARLKRQGKIK